MIIEKRVCERKMWERLINGKWFRFTASMHNDKPVIVQVEEWWADAEHFETVHTFFAEIV